MDLTSLFIKHGILPQDEVLKYLENKPYSFVEDLLKNANVLFLTINDIKRYEEAVAKKRLEIDWKSRIEVLKDITGKSTTKGEANDFVKYFNSRFKLLKKILKRRSELIGSVNIEDALKGSERDVKVIGMVRDLRNVNGGKILEIEDETSTMTVFTSDRKTINHITRDSVVGVIAERSRSSFYAKDLLVPDVMIDRSASRSTDSATIAITSDVHIGSKTFIREKWGSFMDWLGTQDTIRYVLFCGDNVDGVGIYPGQEKDLEVTNVYEQYELFAAELDKIDDKSKEIIVLPGNHDSVRPAEPQPALPKEIRDLFSNNVLCVGSPCFMRISDVPILAYHGRSMDDFIYANSEFTHNKPVDMMVEMLKLRHLVPIYGSKVPIAPESTDYLAMDEVPDIFVTGHVHSFGVGRYRSITLINGSTWQAQTDYQRMLGFEPNPGNVALVDLKSGDIGTKSF
ncbi:MAG: DNA-directed DNA polymerase II small subunit [Candidatus Thermoplasmatota archaeon]|nr:DNA-directed DNA polymerase II small subunit [Candidatus Thermoplasmatota archaeon]